MTKLILSTLFSLFAAAHVCAQQFPPTGGVPEVSALPTTSCALTGKPRVVFLTTGSVGLYQCTGGTYSPSADGPYTISYGVAYQAYSSGASSVTLTHNFGSKNHAAATCYGDPNGADNAISGFTITRGTNADTISMGAGAPADGVCVINDPRFAAGSSGGGPFASAGGVISPTTPTDKVAVGITVLDPVLGEHTVPGLVCDGIGGTNNSAVIQSAVNALTASVGGLIRFPATASTCYMHDQVTIPIATGQNAKFFFYGPHAKLGTDQAISMFRRVPANQTAADNNVGSQVHFQGFEFIGNGASGQKALDIGATYGSTFRDLSFSTLDTALDCQFCLKAIVENSFITGQVTDGIVLRSGVGVWSGSTTSNSQSNHSVIQSNRCYAGSAAHSCIELLASGGADISDNIAEGNNPQYNIIVDAQGSPTVKANSIRNTHIENTPSAAGILVNSSGGSVTIENTMSQLGFPLIDATGSAASTRLIVTNVPYVLASTRGSASFTGSGLNDATAGGTYNGQISSGTYCAKIDTTGTPDKFKWGTNGACDNGATGVSVTGSAQTLSYGATILFAATTGHTLNDKWTISVTAGTTFKKGSNDEQWWFADIGDYQQIDATAVNYWLGGSAPTYIYTDGADNTLARKFSSPITGFTFNGPVSLSKLIIGPAQVPAKIHTPNADNPALMVYNDAHSSGSPDFTIQANDASGNYRLQASGNYLFLNSGGTDFLYYDGNRVNVQKLFSPMSYTWATLSGFGPTIASQGACSDCDTPASEGASCSASGDHAGAFAVYVRGAWHCF
jgi:hypothetical protein